MAPVTRSQTRDARHRASPLGRRRSPPTQRKSPDRHVAGEIVDQAERPKGRSPIRREAPTHSAFKPASLQGLPLELQLEIFRYIFFWPSPILPIRVRPAWYLKAFFKVQNLTAPRNNQSDRAALLRVSKWFLSRAAPVLYGNDIDLSVLACAKSIPHFRRKIGPTNAALVKHVTMRACPYGAQQHAGLDLATFQSLCFWQMQLDAVFLGRIESDRTLVTLFNSFPNLNNVRIRLNRREWRPYGLPSKRTWNKFRFIVVEICWVGSQDRSDRPITSKYRLSGTTFRLLPF